MKRIIDAPQVGPATKEFRIERAEDGNYADNVNPVVEITTLIKPYQNRDWIHRILQGSVMFSASPERTSRQEKHMKNIHDAEYMVELNQLNLILHQTSLTETVFHNTPQSKTARLPQLDDILQIWSCRGVLVTPPEENSNQTALNNGSIIRADKKYQERYVVTWISGEFMTFNYWGPIKPGTMLYFVLKKVPIEAATTYVLFKDQMFIESNEIRTDHLLPPSPIKRTAKMVWQLVPAYPGMPTEKNPYGSKTNSNNLCPDEIEYIDLDEPLYDPNAAPGTPNAAPPGFPARLNGVRKMGHVFPYGICFLNNGYRSGGFYNDTAKKWVRDSPFIYQQPKIHVYTNVQ
jgi:hypothetical protein